MNKKHTASFSDSSYKVFEVQQIAASRALMASKRPLSKAKFKKEKKAYKAKLEAMLKNDRHFRSNIDDQSLTFAEEIYSNRICAARLEYTYSNFDVRGMTREELAKAFVAQRRAAKKMVKHAKSFVAAFESGKVSVHTTGRNPIVGKDGE
jgi:hypothetical protein